MTAATCWAFRATSRLLRGSACSAGLILATALASLALGAIFAPAAHYARRALRPPVQHRTGRAHTIRLLGPADLQVGPAGVVGPISQRAHELDSIVMQITLCGID